MDTVEDRYYRDTPSLNHNLSFAGCGFLGLYHIGVVSCIKEFAPYLYKNKSISGASAGAMAAAFLICDACVIETIQYLTELIRNTNKYILRTLDPRFNLSEHLREGLMRLLPPDAHLICTGRLFISLTCYTTRKNIIVSEFRDRDELITALMCSAHIPIFSGYAPLTFRGHPVFDGGFSDNLLCLDGRTIRISPFSGNADVCPLDFSWGPQYHNKKKTDRNLLGSFTFCNTNIRVTWNNIKRIFNVIWPMSPEKLAQLASQGYADTLRFLMTRGFITCRLHQTPRAFSNMANVQHPPRLRFSTSTSSFLDDLRVRSVKSSKSSSKIQPPSTTVPRLQFSGIGLNVLRCSGCQSMLHKAFHSTLPKEVHSAILDFRKHDKSIVSILSNYINVPYNILRQCMEYVVVSSHSTFCQLMSFPVKLQLRMFVNVIKWLPFQPIWLRTICDHITDYEKNLANSTDNSKLKNRKKSVWRSINSFVKSCGTTVADSISRLNTIELPSAEECGLEMLSHSDHSVFTFSNYKLNNNNNNNISSESECPGERKLSFYLDSDNIQLNSFESFSNEESHCDVNNYNNNTDDNDDDNNNNNNDNNNTDDNDDNNNNNNNDNNTDDNNNSDKENSADQYHDINNDLQCNFTVLNVDTSASVSPNI